MFVLRQGCLRRLHYHYVTPRISVHNNIISNHHNQRRCYRQSAAFATSLEKSTTSTTPKDTLQRNDSSSSANTYIYTPKQSTNDTITIKDRVKIITLQDGIVHVLLSQPNKLNSLDLPMFHAIAETASILKTDTSLNKNLRAVIISGEGRVFSTGLDAKSVALSGPRSALDTLLERPSPYGGGEGLGNLAQDVCYLWR